MEPCYLFFFCQKMQVDLTLFSRKHWDISSVNLKQSLSLSFPSLPFIVPLTDSFYPLFYSHPLSPSLLCSILCCLLRYFILFLAKNVRRNHIAQGTKLGLRFCFPQPTKSLSQSLLSPILCVTLFAAPRNCLGSWLHKCGNNNSE